MAPRRRRRPQAAPTSSLDNHHFYTPYPPRHWRPGAVAKAAPVGFLPQSLKPARSRGRAHRGDAPRPLLSSCVHLHSSPHMCACGPHAKKAPRASTAPQAPWRLKTLASPESRRPHSFRPGPRPARGRWMPSLFSHPEPCARVTQPSAPAGERLNSKPAATRGVQTGALCARPRNLVRAPSPRRPARNTRHTRTVEDAT
jgi:hypothetical protein